MLEINWIKYIWSKVPFSKCIQYAYEQVKIYFVCFLPVGNNCPILYLLIFSSGEHHHLVISLHPSAEGYELSRHFNRDQAGGDDNATFFGKKLKIFAKEIRGFFQCSCLILNTFQNPLSLLFYPDNMFP